MRKLLTALAFVAASFLAKSVDAAPTLVGSQHGICTQASTTSVTCTFPGAITAGNFIVVGCAAANSTAFTISDTSDGSYVVDTSNPLSSLSVALAHFANHSGASPTITCANGGPAANMQMFIAEFSGVATASPVDGTPANNLNLGSSTPTCGTFTTSFANSLIIGYLNTDSSFTITPGTGYTIIDKDEVATIVGGALEYQVGAAGSYNPAFTLSSSGNTWGAAAGYKASAGGGASGCSGLMLGVFKCGN